MPNKKTMFVIPTHTRMNCLAECLSTLRRHEPGTSEYGVVVVFDGGPPGARAALRQIATGPPVSGVLCRAVRGGFASAVNAGIRCCGGAETVILANDDLVFTRPLIERIRAAFRRNPRIGVVGGKLLQMDGSLNHIGAGWDGKRLSLFHVCRKELADVPGHRIVSGALMAIRADVVRRVGFLSEGYGMYHEDVDYCLRIANAGWGVWYDPGVSAKHRGFQSAGGYNYRAAAAASRQKFFAIWSGRALAPWPTQS